MLATYFLVTCCIQQNGIQFYSKKANGEWIYCFIYFSHQNQYPPKVSLSILMVVPLKETIEKMREIKRKRNGTYMQTFVDKNKDKLNYLMCEDGDAFLIFLIAWCKC